MNKIFIAGGSGFIGSNFIYYCIDKGYVVVNYDKLTYMFNKNDPDTPKTDVFRPAKGSAKVIIGNVVTLKPLFKTFIECIPPISPKDFVE